MATDSKDEGMAQNAGEAMTEQAAISAVKGAIREAIREGMRGYDLASTDALLTDALVRFAAAIRSSVPRCQCNRCQRDACDELTRDGEAMGGYSAEQCGVCGIPEFAHFNDRSHSFAYKRCSTDCRQRPGHTGHCDDYLG